MGTITKITERSDAEIDRAIVHFQKAKKLYFLEKLLTELRTNPTSFTAHVHNLRLPLPPKV